MTAVDRADTLGRGWLFTLAEGVDYSVSGNAITLLGALATTPFLSIAVTLETPMTHQVGDQKYYFGDEPILGGDPKTDASNNLVLDSAGNVVLYDAAHPTAYVYDSHGRQLFHKRGAPVLRFDGVNWVADTYTVAGALVYRLGNEPKLYLGGETAYANAADNVTVDTTVFHIQLDGAGGPPATTSSTGTSRTSR